MRDKRPVLVLSELDDYTADCVIMELRRREVPVVRLDPGVDFPNSATFAAHLDDAGSWAGDLMTSTRRLDLALVRSVYRRRPSPYAPSPELEEQAANEARHGFGGTLANLPNCLYVNHPDANYAADVKVTQLRVATELGLRVPASLITNDLGRARAFAVRHGRVICKPLTFVRYVTEEGPRTIWTQPVHPDELDERIAGTAHLFQALVEKVADLRITVVGRHIFCIRIESDPPQLDWRYDYDRLTYTWCDPPAELIEPMLSYLKHLGLASGCFDFGLTDSGEAVFFECNPNGQWGWLEERTGAPITAAFANLLEGGTVTTENQDIDRLADALTASGELTDQEWRRSMHAVPRHLFIPERGYAMPNSYRQGPAAHTIDRAADPEGWRAAVYSNMSVITQRDDGAGDPASAEGSASSSNSAPGVVFPFLELLGPVKGERI